MYSERLLHNYVGAYARKLRKYVCILPCSGASVGQSLLGEFFVAVHGQLVHSTYTFAA